MPQSPIDAISPGHSGRVTHAATVAMKTASVNQLSRAIGGPGSNAGPSVASISRSRSGRSTIVSSAHMIGSSTSTTGPPKRIHPRNEIGSPVCSLSSFAPIAFGGLPTIVRQPPMFAA